MPHTSGPWRFTTYGEVLANDGSYVVINDDSQSIADDANGYLIAAAPQLLAALSAAYDMLREMLGTCEPDCTCVLHEIEAAFAKAEGR
jgi:hypothetical protein